MTTSPRPPTSPRQALIDAAREGGVIWLGMVAIGMGFGVLTTASGLSWWVAPLLSFTIYAGSAEFIVIGMLAAGDPVLAIAATTFLVNSRHAFYGLSFPLHLVEGRLRRVYSIYSLTDEAYALLATRDPRTLDSTKILATQVGLQCSWVSGGLLGALVGNALLGDLKGLDFVLTALFIVLAMNAYHDNPDRVSLGLAVAAGGVAIAVGSGSMLLIAFGLFTAALVVRYRREATRA